jgi:hypothetical protein
MRIDLATKDVPSPNGDQLYRPNRFSFSKMSADTGSGAGIDLKDVKS